MRLDGPKGLDGSGGGGDVVDTEDLSAAADTGGDAGEGAGVAGDGIGLIEDLADDGFA